jgi:hypothetical protein
VVVVVGGSVVVVVGGAVVVVEMGGDVVVAAAVEVVLVAVDEEQATRAIRRTGRHFISSCRESHRPRPGVL